MSEDFESNEYSYNSSDSDQNIFNSKKFEESFPEVNIPAEDFSENHSDEEYSDANDAFDDELEDLDDEFLETKFKGRTDKELKKLKEKAYTLKEEGNKFFKKSKYAKAIEAYTNGLKTCPLKFQKDRAVLFANRAAARINLDKKEAAVLDCNKAIDLDPDYLKAILRRAQLHQKLDNLERSLEDYKRVLELDKNNMEARQACATMPAKIAERNEKLKQEMFGKFKELGNLCLRPFGLSTENFNVVQDPQTGGYSVNFQNNN